MSKLSSKYRRPLAAELLRRLGEPRRVIQAVAGARQVGKTTMVRQVAVARMNDYGAKELSVTIGRYS